MKTTQETLNSLQAKAKGARGWESLMQRITDLEEQLAEKASKQSVAQALHRKINKADFDEMVNKKVDLSDLKRIFETMDTKIDRTRFE